MKPVFFTFLVVTTVIFSSKAQDLGKVIIRNGSNAYPKFIASLNGIRLTNDYNSTVNFDYLDELNYRVKILQAGSSTVLTFMVNSAPKYVSKFMLNRDNAGVYSLVLESKALMDGQPEIPPATTVITTPSITPTVSNVPPSAPTVTANSPKAMSDDDFQEVLGVIKKTNLESTKFTMAKNIFAARYLSSKQVVDVLKSFSLEKSKFEFAKFIYPRVVDKQDYYVVYDVFSLNNSKKELSEFIKNNP